MHDIGILASTNPVALDQACIDLICEQKDGDGASLVNRIESRNERAFIFGTILTFSFGRYCPIECWGLCLGLRFLFLPKTVDMAFFAPCWGKGSAFWTLQQQVSWVSHRPCVCMRRFLLTPPFPKAG